jgi:hypothetical protein|eukprot:COSAG01_NODE_509_length_16084_cov_18.063180_7_plen_183_part_00
MPKQVRGHCARQRETAPQATGLTSDSLVHHGAVGKGPHWRLDELVGRPRGEGLEGLAREDQRPELGSAGATRQSRHGVTADGSGRFVRQEVEAAGLHPGRVPAPQHVASPRVMGVYDQHRHHQQLGSWRLLTFASPRRCPDIGALGCPRRSCTAAATRQPVRTAAPPAPRAPPACPPRWAAR